MVSVRCVHLRRRVWTVGKLWPGGGRVEGLSLSLTLKCHSALQARHVRGASSHSVGETPF